MGEVFDFFQAYFDASLDDPGHGAVQAYGLLS